VPPPPPGRVALPPRPYVEGAETVRLGAQDSGEDLSRRYYYFEDQTARLRFADVREASVQNTFLLACTAALNFGFSASAVWLRLDVEQIEPRQEVWLLTFDYPLLDHIDIFDAIHPGEHPIVRLGDRLPFGDRIVPNPTCALPLRLGLRHRQRLYVGVANESSLQIHPAIVLGSRLFRSGVTSRFSYGVAYGIMLLMALHNLFLFLGVRDMTSLAYVGATLCGASPSCRRRAPAFPS
jgi:two-component system, sensor histidine kinase LadS